MSANLLSCALRDTWKYGAGHLLQKALRTSLVLVLLGGFVSLPLPFIPSTRSESTQETAIGPDALDALARMGKTLGAVAGGVVAGAALGAAATTPYYYPYYPQPYYQAPCGPPYAPDTTACPSPS